MTHAITLPPLELRAAVTALLRREEGVRLAAYDDASGLLLKPGYTLLGHPTIGIGRALDTCGVTSAEADYLLAGDLERIEAALDANIGWWRGLSPGRQVVIVAMAFQLGVGGLMGFRTTLGAVQGGDYGRAAQGMLASRWAEQTPARARRMAQMMQNGT